MPHIGKSLLDLCKKHQRLVGLSKNASSCSPGIMLFQLYVTGNEHNASQRYAGVTCLALSFPLKHSIPEQGSISNSLSETQYEADSSGMIAFVVQEEASGGRQPGAGWAMCQGCWDQRDGHKGAPQRGKRRTRSHRDQLSLQTHKAGDQSLQQLIVLREP